MSENFHALIRETLIYLKDPLLPKQVLFADVEEWAFFQRKQTAPTLPVQNLKIPPLILSVSPIKAHPIAPLPIRQNTIEIETPQSPPDKPAVLAEEKIVSPIKKTLQRIAPHFKLANQVPDDAKAKRIASAWKEKIPDAEVILLACDTRADTLELLKGLAKAIDQHLAKSKVIAADRLEREKRWDLFLQKNPLRLIIASFGMQQLPELMRYYRAIPANAQFFLDQTPLVILSAVSAYKSLEHKALLWKTLCQMLKK